MVPDSPTSAWFTMALQRTALRAIPRCNAAFRNGKLVVRFASPLSQTPSCKKADAHL